MMRIQRKQQTNNVRAFSTVNDAQHDRREAVENELRLPYQERIRLKKLAQRRKRRKAREEMNLVFGTLNVGTMTGKGVEVVSLMRRRCINVLCVQETKWKGERACELGDGFKIFYYGMDAKRNGVGVVVDPELKRSVLSVERKSDRMIWLNWQLTSRLLISRVCTHPKPDVKRRKRTNLGISLGIV